MIEQNTTYILLQHYWFVILALLAGILVFLLFVQGGQTFIFSMGNTERKKTLLVNALGRKWEFTFTTLVTFGGAFFASFPLFYATSFGGAYWVWFAILIVFVIQAVSYEYRSRKGNVYGKKTFDVFLLINGALGPVLLGTAVATLFTGAEFTLDAMREVTWHGAARGLEAVLNPQNVLLGLAVFYLARVNGLLYFTNNIGDDEIMSRIKVVLPKNILLFLVFFLSFVIWLMCIDGAAVDKETGIVSMVQNKYFMNLIQMPVVALLFLTGVVLVLYGFYRILFTVKRKSAIWFTGSGTILTVMALFLMAGFNQTAFYPSTTDLQSSLTLQNASSSYFTLQVMSYVSLLIPFVVGYIWFAWRSVNNKPLTQDEIDRSEAHIY